MGSSAKKATKAATKTVKETVTNPKKAVTAIATGGFSTAYEFGRNQQKIKSRKELRELEAQKEEEASANRADLEAENKALAKDLDIAQREQKKKGIASLVGGSDDTTLG